LIIITTSSSVSRISVSADGAPYTRPTRRLRQYFWFCLQKEQCTIGGRAALAAVAGHWRNAAAGFDERTSTRQASRPFQDQRLARVVEVHDACEDIRLQDLPLPSQDARGRSSKTSVSQLVMRRTKMPRGWRMQNRRHYQPAPTPRLLACSRTIRGLQPSPKCNPLHKTLWILLESGTETLRAGTTVLL
jgi:hypothetical protein